MSGESLLEIGDECTQCKQEQRLVSMWKQWWCVTHKDAHTDYGLIYSTKLTLRRVGMIKYYYYCYFSKVILSWLSKESIKWDSTIIFLKSTKINSKKIHKHL